MGILEDSLRNKMSRLGVSVEQAAILSGIRSQIVFSGLSGRRPFCGPDIEALDRTLKNLQALVDAAKPFPLSLADTRKVKFLLDKLYTGDLQRVMSPFAKIIADEMDRAVM
jgi:hypothetical protein